MKITLRGARVSSGLTVKELAKKIGVTPQTIYNWEQGKSEPKKNQLIALSEALEIGIEYLK